MEITWFLPGELEIRRRGSGSFLSGAFRYGRTATISNRGRARKERIDGRAFIRAVSVNKKRPFERTQKGVVTAWRPVGGCLLRFAENDTRRRKGLSEEFLRKLGTYLLVFLAFAGGNGRAGGDAAERILPSADAQPLL